MEVLSEFNTLPSVPSPYCKRRFQYPNQPGCYRVRALGTRNPRHLQPCVRGPENRKAEVLRMHQIGRRIPWVEAKLPNAVEQIFDPINFVCFGFPLKRTTLVR